MQYKYVFIWRMKTSKIDSRFPLLHQIGRFPIPMAASTAADSGIFPAFRAGNAKFIITDNSFMHRK